MCHGQKSQKIGDKLIPPFNDRILISWGPIFTPDLGWVSQENFLTSKGGGKTRTKTPVMVWTKIQQNILYINTLGFQPPLKQWVEKHNHHCWTLRVLIIQIGSTIILMVVEAQGIYIFFYTGVHSLKLTAITPENRPMPTGNERIPIIHFQVQVLLLLVSGRVYCST